MATLGPDEIKTLEQLRQRLQRFTSSLNDLSKNFEKETPLPSWSALQAHSGLISNNLQEVSKCLSENQQLLSRLVAFPSLQFPSTQSQLLEHLLRTKPEPEVKEWIEAGQSSSATAIKGTYRIGLSDSNREELWRWAPIAANDEVRRQNWDGDYTMTEKFAGIENVQTGLTRELQEPPDLMDQNGPGAGEESDDEMDDDDDEEEAAMPQRPSAALGVSSALSQLTANQMPIESMLRFVSSGTLPNAKPP